MRRRSSPSNQLTKIRSRLLASAGEQGLDLDPGLHLCVEGEASAPERVEGRLYRFKIPAGAVEITLVSRVSVPAEFTARSSDTRRLGVPVECLPVARLRHLDRHLAPRRETLGRVLRSRKALSH